MIVFNPTLEEHTFNIVPRFYPTMEEVILELYNEATQISETIDNTFTITDGIMVFSIEKEVNELDKFQVKIYNNNGVIFRGKAIATSQTPQNFKQTNNLYFYE